MSGFLSNTTALTVCEASGAKFNEDALQKHVFTSTIDADNQRLGWVGLGNPLDVNFAFGIQHDKYAVFSLRVDTRKPSSAAIKLQLAEAIRDKEAAGEKITGKRKKELREAITSTLTSKAPFVPALTDCLWELDKGRLLISTASAKALQPVFGLFKTTFGIEPAPITPKGDMTAIFAEICRNEQYECNGFVLSPFGSASLATSEQSVAVQNNLSAVASALDEGLTIQKLRLIATAQSNPELQLDFTLDTALAVSGLRLPKVDKDADDEAELLLKADVCFSVANIIKGLTTA